MRQIGTEKVTATSTKAYSIREVVKEVNSTTMIDGVKTPEMKYRIEATVTVRASKQLTPSSVAAALKDCTFPFQSGEGSPTTSEDGMTLSVIFVTRASLHARDTHTREPFTEAVTLAAERLAKRI